MARLFALWTLLFGAGFALPAGATVSGDWPPPIEALVDEDGCRAVLPCDRDARPGIALEPVSEWRRVVETKRSSCSSAVQAFDSRTREGNVLRETSVMAVHGTCVVDEKGRTVGAVRDGILATCQAKKQRMGVVSHEAAIVDLRAGRGRARAPLTGLPWLLTGQSRCEVEVDVVMEPVAAPSPAVSAPAPPAVESAR